MNEEEDIEDQSAEDIPKPQENVDEIISQKQPIKVKESQTENMEVHKHPHHVTHKKKWGEYLVEFFMLFLAVFLGFLAENVREHQVEKAKEKEYIISMIEDAKTDTANLQRSITINRLRAKHLDTLEALCLNYNASGRDDKEILKLSGYSQIYANVVRLTERTIQQLKNAGGMRLIKSKAAIDSIILYDDMNKKLADQQAYYELYQNKTIDIGAQIMNFKNLEFKNNAPLFKNAVDTSQKLIIKNDIKLMEYGNMIDMYQAVVELYTFRLQEAKEHAVNLINILKKEYHLENE